MTYRVETVDNAWSYIVGPNGYREGPIRYREDAEEWAAEMNAGKPPPAEELRKLEKSGANFCAGTP